MIMNHQFGELIISNSLTAMHTLARVVCGYGLSCSNLHLI